MHVFLSRCKVMTSEVLAAGDVTVSCMHGRNGMSLVVI